MDYRQSLHPSKVAQQIGSLHPSDDGALGTDALVFVVASAFDDSAAALD
jgi:hypothetical protein